MKRGKGFTLVELLAVIVILAIILVIAVPQIMGTIKSSRSGSLKSTVQLIASSAETAYMTKSTLGESTSGITCSSVATLPKGIINDDGDATVENGECKITFDNGTAKVTISGTIASGQFKGCAVAANATKEAATVTGSGCV